MNLMFTPDQFPNREQLKRGVWAPLLFAPNPDSPERLVVAVAAAGADEFHVAAADSSRRLACLYGAAAATALLAQTSAVKVLREQLSRHGADAIRDCEFPLSGISLGPVREGEARSMEALACQWLQTISSLHAGSATSSAEQDESAENAVAAIESQADNDRLPVLVYRAVEESDPPLASFFSADIRSRAKKSPRPAPQKVFIGFAGQNVVANFATLKPGRSRVMVDHVKRLMWDLARFRDDEAGRISHDRAYEMVVFRRDENDPDISASQAGQLREMLEDLREQGAKDAIEVRPRSSIDQIADLIRVTERSGSHF